ncbi:MAG: universal stress protein [Cyanobacteria bacterium QS_8_64_29]|nr:MAG: universal stress protein [Cyanobacteria bacterium QS_8_64_29]
MLNKLLLADAGTGHVEEALQYLLELPALKDTTVTVLHVVSAQTTTAQMAEQWEQGGRLLAEVLQRLELDPQHASTVLRQGDPKDTIPQVAEEVDADLIVMGSRGLKRLEAILANSVSQYVFQLTNRSLLLVKDDIYVRRFKRLMVALDGSQAAQYCLDLALFLMREHSALQLDLVHVDPNLDKEAPPQSPETAEQDPVLAPAARQAQSQGVAHRCIATGGAPAETLCNLAQQNRADLLLLGSPERRPSVAKSLPDLDRLLGTSISDYVRVNATCPVLLGRMPSST